MIGGEDDGADDQEAAAQVEALLDTPNLANALESERFKQFLDHVPFAVAVSELHPSERLIYANLEFERLTGISGANVEGRSWNALPLKMSATEADRELAEAVTRAKSTSARSRWAIRATLSMPGRAPSKMRKA
jgi:PAS domain-containing protein